MDFTSAAIGATLVPIIDHLESLLKIRNESRHGLVNDIVAPFFVSLETAYEAYLASLRRIDSLVTSGIDYSAIYTEIEALKASDLIARSKVRAMATAFEERFASYSDILQFFNASGCLFGFWNDQHNSATLRILTALKEGAIVWNRDFLYESVLICIDFSEITWKRLASDYAHIRANYLKP